MKRKRIAILIDFHDINGYHSLLMNGINTYCREKQIDAYFYSVGRLESPFQEEHGRYELYNLLYKNRFDGIIVFGVSIINFSHIAKLEEKLAPLKELPMVFFSVQSALGPSVFIDNVPGFTALLDHLFVHHTFKNIAYISGPLSSPDGSQRLELFREGMKRHNIKLSERMIYYGQFTVNSGLEGVRYFLDELEIQPDLIICANDEMVVGAWRELRKRKLLVPHNVALTGFDDLEASPYFALPFTTVKQPLFLQGYLSTKMLIQMIDEKSEEPHQNIELPTKMIIRKSCGCLANPNHDIGENSSSQQKLEDETKRDFFAFKREDILLKLQMELDGLSGMPLMRSWNSFLLECSFYNLNFDEVKGFLEDLKQLFGNIYKGERDQFQIQKLVSEMYQLLYEFYQQIDLLSKIETTRMNQMVIVKTDELIQNLIHNSEMSDSFSTLPEILRMLDVDYFFITLYEDDHHDMGNLVFAYQNGNIEELTPGEQIYSLDTVLPPQFLQSQNRSRMVQALYEDDQQLGFIIMSIGDRGIENYEILRKKLSQGLRTVVYTEQLKELNKKLKDEISIRQETEAQLKVAMKSLKDLSVKDEMTGLYNRRGFLNLGSQQLNYCRKKRYPFTILFVDMDGLKEINDQHGHQEGDAAIRLVADVLKQVLRSVDIIGRLGGDEFTVFLTKASDKNASTFLSRIQTTLEKENKKRKLPYTVSISVGTYSNSENPSLSLSQMMSLADHRLYEIKKSKK